MATSESVKPEQEHPSHEQARRFPVATEHGRHTDWTTLGCIVMEPLILRMKCGNVMYVVIRWWVRLESDGWARDRFDNGLPTVLSFGIDRKQESPRQESRQRREDSHVGVRVWLYREDKAISSLGGPFALCEIYKPRKTTASIDWKIAHHRVGVSSCVACGARKPSGFVSFLITTIGTPRQ